MHIRRIILSFISVFSVVMFFGCSNNIEKGYSGGYPNYSEGDAKTTVECNKTKMKNRISSSILTSEVTTVLTTIKLTTTPNLTTVTTVATTEAATATAVTNAIIEPVPEELIPKEPVTIVSVVTEPNTSIPDDTLAIKEVIIPLTYGIPTQELVDNSDVVCDTSLVTGINTFLAGHSYKSFDILDSVSVGEKFAMNNHGEVKIYEVQRSERAYLNAQGTKVFFCSDDAEVIYHDYGYTALILFTCDKQDPGRYRWLVVAKEV